jgi:hypothetical protein
MKRLRVFFATILILLAVPLWRLLDLLIWTWPSDLVFGLVITFLTGLFLLGPLRLIKPSLPKSIFLLAPFMGLLSFYSGTFSRMTTLHPELSHCGSLSYTGFIYPARGILTNVHQDDLEARNQLCWLRKMIVRTPAKTDSEYLKLTIKKLQMPENKYRVSLPLIAFLQGYMMMSLDNSTWDNVQQGKDFLDSLHYWRDLYAIEISEREYAWYDWPFSSLVHFEYGLVEKNWQSIIDGITFNEI